MSAHAIHTNAPDDTRYMLAESYGSMLDLTPHQIARLAELYSETAKCSHDTCSAMRLQSDMARGGMPNGILGLLGTQPTDDEKTASLAAAAQYGLSFAAYMDLTQKHRLKEVEAAIKEPERLHEIMSKDSMRSFAFSEDSELGPCDNPSIATLNTVDMAAVLAQSKKGKQASSGFASMSSQWMKNLGISR